MTTATATPTKTPITLDGLRHGLLNVKGAKPVSFVARTIPTMKVKDANNNPNPFIRGKGESKEVLIRKVVKINGMIGFNYEAGVVRRVEKQINAEREAKGETALTGEQLEKAVNETFKRGTSWHIPVIDGERVTVLSAHKDTPLQADYLRFMARGKTESVYVHIETGELVGEDEVAPFMSPPLPYKNQGLEEPLIFLAYALENIREISIGGERYIVEIEPIGPNFMRALTEVCASYDASLSNPSQTANA